MHNENTCFVEYLNDLVLLELAEEIGQDNFRLGIRLGLGRPIVEAVRADNGPVIDRSFYMLLKWKQTKTNPESVETLKELCAVLDKLGRVDLVNFVKSGELMPIIAQ